MIALSSHLRSKVYLLLLIAFLSNVHLVRAQTSNVQTISSQARIDQTLDLLRTADQNHLSQAQRAVLWKNLALNYHSASDFPKAEDAYNRALHLLKPVPSDRTEYASTLDDLASLYLTYGRLDDAESSMKQALKVRQNRPCGERSTPGGYRSRATPVQEGGTFSSAGTRGDGIFIGSTQDRDALRIYYSDLRALLTGPLR